MSVVSTSPVTRSVWKQTERSARPALFGLTQADFDAIVARDGYVTFNAAKAAAGMPAKTAKTPAKTGKPSPMPRQAGKQQPAVRSDARLTAIEDALAALQVQQSALIAQNAKTLDLLAAMVGQSEVTAKANTQNTVPAKTAKTAKTAKPAKTPAKVTAPKFAMGSETCLGTKADGKPCGSRFLAENGYCKHHVTQA
jgi:hypothetical protein